MLLEKLHKEEGNKKQRGKASTKNGLFMLTNTNNKDDSKVWICVV